MPGVRAAVARLLVRPSARTARWPAFLVVVPLGAFVVRQGARDGGDPSTIALPIATTLLGAWLCLAFEDAAAQVTSPVPAPLALRRAVRASITVSAATLAWFAITFIGPLSGPTRPMTQMYGVVAIVALACAALAARAIASERSGIAAIFGLIGTIVALPIVLGLVFDRPVAIDPSRVPIGNSSSYWATMAVLAAVVLAFAHRDPALAGPLAWLRSRRVRRAPTRAVPAREMH